MLKLIFKNLWARRRRNGWLLAELVLVSIVSWIILDPVIVVTHDRNIPLGYDADRLCMVSLAGLQPQAPGYDPQAQDSAVMVGNYLQFVRRVQDYPGVELAAPVLGFCYPNSQGSSNNMLYAEGDTIAKSVMMVEFLPHTRFFETFGFQSGKGRTVEELSDYNYTRNDIVATDNTLEALFHTNDPSGKRCYNAHHEGDATYMPVVGAVETFRMYTEWRPVPVVFWPILSINHSDIPESARILIRLKKDVSMDHFLHDFRAWMVKELRAGNLFAREVKSYDQLITEREYTGQLPFTVAIWQWRLSSSSISAWELSVPSGYKPARDGRKWG